MEAGDRTRVTVTIYGTQYKLMGKGSNSSAYLQMIAAQVDEQMKTIAASAPHLDMPRVSVLTSVNLADELNKLKKSHEKLEQELEIVREEQRTLQKQYKLQLNQVGADGEQDESDLQKELRKLQEEYKKLQSEYNEWVELFNNEDSGT